MQIPRDHANPKHPAESGTDNYENAVQSLASMSALAVDRQVRIIPNAVCVYQRQYDLSCEY